MAKVASRGCGAPGTCSAPATRLVQCEAKRNPNQPCPEPGPITKTFEAPVGLQHGLLRHVFGIGAVAQNTTRHPKGQCPTLCQTLFELPFQSGLIQFKDQLGIRRATGPDQGQFLHPFSPYNCQTPPSGIWFTRSSDYYVRGSRF